MCRLYCSSCIVLLYGYKCMAEQLQLKPYILLHLGKKIHKVDALCESNSIYTPINELYTINEFNSLMLKRQQLQHNYIEGDHHVMDLLDVFFPFSSSFIVTTVRSLYELPIYSLNDIFNRYNCPELSSLMADGCGAWMGWGGVGRWGWGWLAAS